MELQTRVLSKEQLDFFNREGYVIVKNVWSSEEIEKLKKFFREKFKSEFWKVSPYNSPTIINDIYRHFPELIDVIFKPKYIDAIKDILGENLICMPECSIHYNRFFDWHKDTTHMDANGGNIHHSGKSFLVQSGVYFQDNSPEGGGLTVVPGSMRNTDRFVKMHYGGLSDRVYNKLLKVLGRSAFQQIDKNEKPVDIPTKAGDLLIFNNKLDHRATFLRGRNGKAITPKKEKFAIFNTFGNDKALMNEYLESMRSLDESYSKYLRQTTSAPVVVKKAEELRFSLCY